MLKKISCSKDFIAVIILFFASFIFLHNLFLNNQLFTAQDIGQGDITHYTYPDRDFYSQEIKNLHLPLWTNQISTGYPIFAEGQLGALFIPNIIAYFLFPTYFAFNLTYFIAFLIAAVGTYFYARRIKLNMYSSLLAAIVYSFSFYFIGHVLHLTILQAISLFPWLLLVVDKFFTNGSRYYLLIFIFLFSQQYLSGYIQCVVYSISAVYLIMGISYYNKPHFIKYLSILTLGCLLAIGISAIQLIPSLELYNLSTRSTQAVEHTKYYYSYKDLVYFLNPFFWGDPSRATYSRDPLDGLFWENNIYSGVIPFIFLIIGSLAAFKNKFIRPYIYFFLITICFSLGLLFFLEYIPPLSSFRLPQRALFLTSFAYAMIAAFGFELSIRKLKSSTQNKHIILFIILVLLLLSYADIFINGSEYNGGISKDSWLKPPATTIYLQHKHLTGRIMSAGGLDNWLNVYDHISHGWRGSDGTKLLESRETLSPNTNMLSGLDSISGYTVFDTTNFVLLSQLMTYGDETYKLSTSSAKLLGMEGVEYIVSATNIKSDSNDLTLVWHENNKDTQTDYKIYKNKQFINLIHPIAELDSVLTTQQMVNAMLDSTFSPSNTALVFDSYPPRNFSTNVIINNIRRTNQEMNFETNSKSNSFIVISQNAYPGWKALVDGHEVLLLTVNVNNLGIQLSPGEHKIKIYYAPESLVLGIKVTIFSLVIILIVLFWPRLRVLKNFFIRNFVG